MDGLRVVVMETRDTGLPRPGRGERALADGAEGGRRGWLVRSVGSRVLLRRRRNEGGRACQWRPKTSAHLVAGVGVEGHHAMGVRCEALASCQQLTGALQAPFE